MPICIQKCSEKCSNISFKVSGADEAISASYLYVSLEESYEIQDGRP